MPAGTITLTNNSTAVTGSGTAFPTELKANDFLVAVVGGTTYTLGVKSVESATALTLTTAYGGPTTGGLAWTPIPNGTLVGITAQIAADTARAIRGLNYDKQNWQQVYSASGNITVMLPDGSTWAGPSWNGVSTKLNGKLDKSENLNDLGDKAQSQKNLGLGDSAVRDVNKLLVSDSSPSVPVMLQMNSDFRNVISYDTLGEYPLGLSAGLATGKQLPGSGVAQGGFVGLINARTWGNNSAGQCSFQIAVNDNVAGFRRTYIANGTWFYSNFLSWYHSGNTTRASDGTLKAASPVVKIFANGNAETNEESEGVTVTRQAPGVYLVEGCMGMNADAAWGGIDGGFDIPTDRNKQPLVWLDYEVNPDGSVLVKTYHRTYPDAPTFAQNRIGYKNDDGSLTETVMNGDPVDIPADQFVSVRVEMPHDSIYNQAQEAAQKALEEAARKATEEA